MDFPAFSPAPPKNAIRTHHGSTNTCDHCGKHATQRCGQCPRTEPTYYFSKACQKSDWGKHKNYCRSKQLYAAVVDLWLPDPQPLDTERLVAIVKECKVNLSVDLMEYLGRVPVAARPRTMLAHAETDRMTVEAVNMHNKLATTSKAKYKSRVTHLQRTKYKDTRPWDIPLGDRPLGPGDDFIEEGVLIWWVDYEMLSIGHYISSWGGGRTTVADPWGSRLEIALDDLVMVAPGEFVPRKDLAAYEEAVRRGEI